MAPTQVLRQTSSLSFPPRKLDWLASNGDMRMAAVTDHEQRRQSWSMNDLSSELLDLIFKQVRNFLTAL